MLGSSFPLGCLEKHYSPAYANSLKAVPLHVSVYSRWHLDEVETRPTTREYLANSRNSNLKIWKSERYQYAERTLGDVMQSEISAEDYVNDATRCYLTCNTVDDAGCNKP